MGLDAELYRGDFPFRSIKLETPDVADRIEIPSEKYPEHLFKIGYMRDGSYCSTISEITGMDLYAIWGNGDQDQYEYFQLPDLEDVRKRLAMIEDTIFRQKNHAAGIFK